MLRSSRRLGEFLGGNCRNTRSSEGSTNNNQREFWGKEDGGEAEALLRGGRGRMQMSEGNLTRRVMFARKEIRQDLESNNYECAKNGS